MVNFAGGDFYGADEQPKLEWSDNNTRLWYEERPRMILHFYRPENPNWKHYGDVSVFVNMSFQPTTEAIEAFIHRGLKAGGIEYEGIVNLRLNNWSGETNAFWYADMLSGRRNSNSLREE